MAQAGYPDLEQHKALHALLEDRKYPAFVLGARQQRTTV